jgi:hypothetical protein
MIPEALPPAVRENHDQVVAALRSKESGDSALARALWENARQGFYRVHGFRSVQEYLRERFVGTELGLIAQGCARGVQRLIKEYKLAAEISVFREAFDKISRSNRRLIAQVLTPENAAEWVRRALELTSGELEELIVVRKVPKNDQLVEKRFKLYPGQLGLVEMALLRAGALLAEDGLDPQGAESGRLEMLAQEFLATYEEGARQREVVECPICRRVAAVRLLGASDEGSARVLDYECLECRGRLALVGVVDKAPAEVEG